MVRLRVLDILKEQNHSKYWLYKQMELSYQNFNRMVQNETSSIKFENLEKLCSILNCSIGDLFEITNNTTTDKKINPSLPKQRWIFIFCSKFAVKY